MTPWLLFLAIVKWGAAVVCGLFVVGLVIATLAAAISFIIDLW